MDNQQIEKTIRSRKSALQSYSISKLFFKNIYQQQKLYLQYKFQDGDVIGFISDYNNGKILSQVGNLFLHPNCMIVFYRNIIEDKEIEEFKKIQSNQLIFKGWFNQMANVDQSIKSKVNSEQAPKSTKQKIQDVFKFSQQNEQEFSKSHQISMNLIQSNQQKKM